MDIKALYNAALIMTTVLVKESINWSVEQNEASETHSDFYIGEKQLEQGKDRILSLNLKCNPSYVEWLGLEHRRLKQKNKAVNPWPAKMHSEEVPGQSGLHSKWATGQLGLNSKTLFNRKTTQPSPEDAQEKVYMTFSTHNYQSRIDKSEKWQIILWH